ncbi:hypothetical protein Tco_0666602, partial [Tanacetum coccineum]
FEIKEVKEAHESNVRHLEAAAEMSHQGGHVASIWTKKRYKELHKVLRRVKMLVIEFPPFTEISSRDLVEMPERCQGMIMSCKSVANHVGYRFGNEQILMGASFTPRTISSYPLGGLAVKVIRFLVLVCASVPNHALLSDPLTSGLCWWLPPKFEFPVFATGVPVGPVFLLGLLAPAIVAVCASRAAAMPSAMSYWIAAKVMAASRGYGMIHDEDEDNDAYDDDGDDDVREISWYYETIRWHPKDPPDLFGDELGFLQ